MGVKLVLAGTNKVIIHIVEEKCIIFFYIGT